MVQAGHRPTSEPQNPAFHVIPAVDPNSDVASQLASRVGELYASEELQQRQERSERMIQRASVSFKE
jgi:hypothetical protein